jgi:hypothetical protein
MKIIENTPDRLVLRSYPTLQIVFGLVFAITGLVITYFFGRSIDIHCQKVGPRQINCLLTQKLLGYQELGQRSVLGVQKADVAESQDSDGNSTYRVVLVTGAGKAGVTTFYSSGYSAKNKLAQRINNFIQDERQTALDATLPMEWWILIFLFAFTGVGIVTILFAKTTGIEMVHSEGVMRIAKDGLFGSGQEEHLLQEIESVVLESSRSSRGGTTYRIAFQVVGGGELLLTRWFSSGRKDKQNAVDAMNNFLVGAKIYGNSPSA